MTTTAKKTAPKKKQRFCIEADCKSESMTHGYCRLHYIANWKLIKLSNHIKAEKRLNAYVDRIAKKYPKDYLEKIKEGLESEDTFRAHVEEISMEEEKEENETENEFLEKFLRDVKGETE